MKGMDHRAPFERYEWSQHDSCQTTKTSQLLEDPQGNKGLRGSAKGGTEARGRPLCLAPFSFSVA